MSQDPFAPYLQQADALFAAGDVVKAGQIWQAILKREPAHAHAREGLLRVKAILDRQKAAAAAPSAAPTPAPAPAVDVEALVRSGATLYDMGQVEEALRTWEEALAVDPAHALAQTYAASARKELGLAEGAPLPTPAPPPSPAPPHPPPAPTTAGDPATTEAIDALLRGAAQLYDMGVVEEAMDKWRQVLALDPDHAQVQSFIRMAEKEEEENRRRWAAATTAVAQQTPVEEVPAALKDATTAMPTHLPGQDPRLAQAKHLLETGHAEEAVVAFRRLVEENPNNQEARTGLSQAQAARVAATSPGGQGDRLMADWVVATKPVAVPATLTAAPAKREGLALPKALTDLTLPPWVLTPKFLGSVAGGLVVLGLGLNLYRGIQKDRQLEADVRSAMAAAKGPVAKATAIVDLAEGAGAILSEGQAALKDDPLRAYHRAKEVLRRAPADGAAAQLLERARLALVPLGTAPVGRAEAEAAFRAGDLQKADHLFDSVLRADPDNPDLIRRACQVLSLLAQQCATKREWAEAREALQRARALTPGDPVWSGRLHLLDRIQGQPKQEQSGWIALL